VGILTYTVDEFLGGKITLFGGDNRVVLIDAPDNSIDAILTDGPYALVSIVKRFGGANAAPAKGNEAFTRASKGFMGKTWDTGEVVNSVEFWAECLRVLKPGGHLLSFGGTRTYHRMACAVEDAGFEIRDMIQWIYGSGFPKSHDVSKGIDKAAGVERTVSLGKSARHGGGIVGAGTSFEVSPEIPELYAPATDEAKQWEGWGTALKPANEPIVLARKPLSEKTVAANVLKWGTGAINIDGCRVKSDGEHKREFQPTNNERGIYGEQTGFQPSNKEGRFPANVITDGSDEVVAAFPDTKSGAWNGTRPGDKTNSVFVKYGAIVEAPRAASKGSAARFFFKALENDSEWLDQNLNLSTAEIAESHSYRLNGNVSIALNDVVTSALPEGFHCESKFPGLFMNATPNELRALATHSIELIQNIVTKSLLGQQLESSIELPNNASCVVQRTQTGIITITISHWISDGSAAPVIFNIMQQNSEVGEKDLRPSTASVFYHPKANKKDRANSKHPTVKPIALMRYLARLITPPGGTILDPFAGSGTTGEAAYLEGFSCYLIEREQDYRDDIAARFVAMNDNEPQSRAA
jgi:DNA modification methylase